MNLNFPQDLKSFFSVESAGGFGPERGRPDRHPLPARRVGVPCVNPVAPGRARSGRASERGLAKSVVAPLQTNKVGLRWVSRTFYTKVGLETHLVLCVGKARHYRNRSSWKAADISVGLCPPALVVAGSPANTSRGFNNSN